jgi:hypothetical protein
MATKKSKDTIAALLGSAPALSRSRTLTAPTRSPRRSTSPGRAKHSPSGSCQPTCSPYRRWRTTTSMTPTLEAFELNTSAPLVKPRRRRQVDYQTLRIQKHTWRIMRDSWLRARQIDPLVTFVEFSTVVIQRGLQALKEDRERGE